MKWFYFQTNSEIYNGYSDGPLVPLNIVVTQNSEYFQRKTTVLDLWKRNALLEYVQPTGTAAFAGIK